MIQDGGGIFAEIGFFDSTNDFSIRTGPENASDIRLEPGDDVLVGSTVRLSPSENGVDGGQVALHMAGGTETVVIDAEVGDGRGAELRLRNALGGSSVIIDGDDADDGAQILLSNGNGDTTIFLEADSEEAPGSAEFRLRNGTSSNIWMEASHVEDGVDTGARIRLRDSTGATTIILDAERGVGGNARITTEVLTITGGADLSEQFDITAPDGPVRPGTVVSIDPNNAGKLIPSLEAYERTVAGIVSGAGGVATGMLMGQEGSIADGKHAVALTGRVYCRADARNGAIRPGDLLTSSHTPGHAMWVTDHERAQGAIIGKAMTALDEGSGLVLVLVSLQ